MKYLAFDFGDGTTTAAYYAPGMNTPKELPIMRGVKEIPTVIGYPPAPRPPVIGMAAINSPGCCLVQNWRMRPTDMDQEDRQHMIDFMSQVNRQFMEHNGPNFIEDDYKTCIGVPCYWSDEDIEEYRKISEEAGLHEVEVLRESQSAILFARNFMQLPDGEGISDNAINEGLLLVDIGSSTTGFTYVKGLEAVHYGVDLGTKFIDRIILQSALNNQGEDRFPYQNYENNRNPMNRHVYLCRAAKEAYFSNADNLGNCKGQSFVEWIPPNRRYTFLFGDRDNNGDLSKTYIDKLLNSKDCKDYTFEIPHLEGNGRHSWRKHFRMILDQVKEKWKIDSRSVTIVATGGATRMDFIEDDIRAAFGKDEGEIFFDNEHQRSFSVVMGLAWAAYANDKIKTVKQDLHSSIRINCTDAIREHTRKIFMPIAEQIANSVSEELCSELKNRDPRVNTIRKLDSRQSELLVSKLNYVRSNINDEIYKIIQEILSLKEVKGLTESLHEEFSRTCLSFNEKLSDVFEADWINVPTDVSYFAGQRWNKPSSEDEVFSKNIIFESHYDVAIRNIRKQLDKIRIMELLEKRPQYLGAGDVIDADVNRCNEVILQKLEDYKKDELDALAGLYSIHND